MTALWWFGVVALVLVAYILLDGCTYACTGDGSASGIPTDCRWQIGTKAFTKG